jgi:hypothetical protein
MKKTLGTLVEDIYALFGDADHKVSPHNLELFKEDIAQVVKEAVEADNAAGEFYLRMSNIGTKDRKLYYDSRTGPEEQRGFKPKDYVKFLYGHMLEHLIIFLAREAGHEVTNEQEEVELDGVQGHKDCHIDGCLVDIKSASPYSFNKFADGSFAADDFRNDSFGYRYQLSGYFEADRPDEDEVAWVVVNKEDGGICVTSFEHFELPSASKRIQRAKQITDKNNTKLPERCWEPTIDKQGNKLVPKLCTYCPHLRNSNRCWGNDVKVHQYANGPKFFLEVNSNIRVPDISERFFK